MRVDPSSFFSPCRVHLPSSYHPIEQPAKHLVKVELDLEVPGLGEVRSHSPELEIQSWEEGVVGLQGIEVPHMVMLAAGRARLAAGKARER
jgi:hypothetical protein